MPTLQAFAKTVVHCGGPGPGMVAKLARNAITYGQWAVIREAASLVHAGGVPLAKLLEVLVEGDDEGTDRLNLLKGAVAGMKASEERIESADYLAQKDLAAAQEFAGSAGLETSLIDVMRARMRDVYSGHLDEPLPADRHARGMAMIDRAYGPGHNT